MDSTRPSVPLGHGIGPGFARAVAAAAALLLAGCHGHATVLDAGGRNADPALVASLSVDASASLAEVTLSDSAYVAVFRWRPPAGFQLIAPDPTSGEVAHLGPGEYVIGTGDSDDDAAHPSAHPSARRVHLVLVASRRPLDTRAWGDQLAVAGPDARVVTRRSAMVWLVESVVDVPESTAWLLVEDHAVVPAETAVARPGEDRIVPRSGVFSPGTRRSVDRSGGPPPASQPERRPD